MKVRRGKGLLNKLIDNLPFEAHIPHYSYCGPGTRLDRRQHQDGINPLDSACKAHDLKYADKSADRKQADFELENRAWERVLAKDSKLPEKTAAWFVTNAMKLKRKMGAGMRKKKQVKTFSFRKLSRAAENGMKSVSNQDNIKLLSKQALMAARRVIRGKSRFNKKLPRVLKVPRTISGGFLPAAIPILAGLSALGSIMGGVGGIAKAIADFRAASSSGAVTPIKSGKGLYIKPYSNYFNVLSKN